jgi:hypothetical protein
VDIDQFWEIVESGKDSEEPETAVREKLARLAPADIVAFQAHFDTQFAKAYRWDLWGAAYIIEGGCSDDGFVDFRYALISKGRGIFEAALRDPDTLAEADIVANEEYGYVAGEVYEAATGNELPRDAVAWPNEPEGEDWDFDDAQENARRLPKLWQLFGW